MTQMHLGWHFCAMRDGKPVLRDGTPLEIGRTYEHVGKLVMCPNREQLSRGEGGYHDSERVIDALKYAPGPNLCRVLSSRDITETDKRVNRYRLALVSYDATRELQQLAIACAYGALVREREAGREPDPRSWDAVAVAVACLRGKTTADAARHAAHAAGSATNTAWRAADAAGSAADAAWHAANAAWHAADAAWHAAHAARYAAYAAGRAGDAARYAANAVGRAAAAARNAAYADADRYLLSLLPAQLVDPALLEP